MHFFLFLLHILCLILKADCGLEFPRVIFFRYFYNIMATFLTNFAQRHPNLTNFVVVIDILVPHFELDLIFLAEFKM